MSAAPTRAPQPDSLAPAYDEPYTFARPAATYLAMREIVRLTILRSKLGDRTSAGSPTGD